MGGSISASNSDMAALDGRNSQADHIFRAACVVLRVLVRPLTTKWEVGTCWYLLPCLIGPQFPLVESLLSQFVDAIEEDLSLLATQMATIHHCTAFAYDVFSVIGTYLNAYMKLSLTASMSDPGGKIPISFWYLME